GLNKEYGTYILASEDLRAAAGEAFEWRRLDHVAVVGRTEGTAVSELLGERGAVAAEVLAGRGLCGEALGADRARRVAEAAAGFRRAAAARPGDRAAQVMSARAEELASQVLADDWDAVYRFKSK